jgi:hypothetical protein
MFIESDDTIATIIAAHENGMLLHVIVMVSDKVQVRIGNKMLETIKGSTIREYYESKSGTSINETCLQSKVERYCNRIYKRVTFCG